MKFGAESLGAGQRGEQIGLFGGTFDPVHNGHLGVARYVLAHTELDRILFIPAPHPPHKRAPVASFRQRVAMLELALADEEQLTVSLVETEYSGLSYTIRTVRQLRQRYVQDRLFLIIGADSLKDLPRWHRAEELLQAVSLIVAGRDKVDHNIIEASIKALPVSYQSQEAPGRWGSEPGRSLVYLGDTQWPVSSSEVRAQLERGQAPSMVPAPVYRYIRSNNLYGCG
ncbi:nicotinate (nicotinamide) nucleotide adenylyltransferase [Desulfogranum mediterraneum]|uniref:nicotinate (nicotinamide) nucleotide adenylyltransferase n=1 Tax=Desulfogranum mediterraneum TaxID=160661 RepID=UPI00041261DC|nr:nicotinate (nicotinamide) nucleotide adenylyltransferase [Desulfogranum mediterraneum]